jgi:hypothetical protein
LKGSILFESILENKPIGCLLFGKENELDLVQIIWRLVEPRRKKKRRGEEAVSGPAGW